MVYQGSQHLVAWKSKILGHCNLIVCLKAPARITSALLTYYWRALMCVLFIFLISIFLKFILFLFFLLDYRYFIFSVGKSMKQLLVSKNMNMEMMSVSSNESVNGTETMKNEIKTNFF